MNEGFQQNRPVVQRMDSDMHGSQRGGSKLPWIVLALVVVVLIVVAVLFRDKIFTSSKSGAVTGKTGEYQSVFLTNGQVYFGKMTEENDHYIKLTDIFYLQVQNPPIQGSQQQQQQAQQQPQLQLVKLGSELHGPVDEMHINRDQVLFFEDMKADGKVVQAIKEYKANPTGSTGQQQGQQPATGQQQQPAQQQTPPAQQQTPAPTPAPKQ